MTTKTGLHKSKTRLKNHANAPRLAENALENRKIALENEKITLEIIEIALSNDKIALEFYVLEGEFYVLESENAEFQLKTPISTLKHRPRRIYLSTY